MKINKTINWGRDFRCGFFTIEVCCVFRKIFYKGRIMFWKVIIFFKLVFVWGVEVSYKVFGEKELFVIESSFFGGRGLV